MFFKPTLAGTQEQSSLNQLTFPLYASPKIDGFRMMVQGGKMVSRTLKPIPNRHLNQVVEPIIHLLEGMDGELICGDPTADDTFRTTGSKVFSMDGCPKVTYYVFDLFGPGPFEQRLQKLQDAVKLVPVLADFEIKVLPQEEVESVEHLKRVEEIMLGYGFEGVMLRSKKSPYKQGRSTVNEGYLLKLKRFVDSEALVLELIEQKTNTNAATTNSLGYAQRSSHQANKVPKGTLGAFRLQDLKSGVIFKCSTGNLTEKEGQAVWDMRDKLMGRICRYKYFPKGNKDLPRFPEFQGFRPIEDLALQ